MTRRYLIAALLGMALLMCGCPQRMINVEIIDTVKRCESAGLIAEPLRDANGLITGIQCAPSNASVIQQSTGGANVVGNGNSVNTANDGKARVHIP